MDVHIRRLREKLEDRPAQPQHILTKWELGTILKAKRHIQRFSRTQLRYAMMYVGITSVVLIFLNLYAATTMRNLVFRSKETSLEDKGANGGLGLLRPSYHTGGGAEKIMDQLGNLNATRVW